MLRFLTAGESHGKALVAILEGIPAGLLIDFSAITTELRRRKTCAAAMAKWAWRSNKPRSVRPGKAGRLIPIWRVMAHSSDVG